MNTLYESEDTLLNDLNYSRRLKTTKQKLGKSLHVPFMIHSRTSEPGLTCDRKFSSHPRNCSESDTSFSTSPRQNRSNYDFEIENLERNKEKIKNARKKLHEKFTNIYPVEEPLFDINIGDSFDRTRENSFSNIFNRTANYDRNGMRGTSEIKETYLYKRKSSAPTPVIKYKTERQEEKSAASKFFTAQPQLKLISENVFEKKFKSFVEKSLQTLGDIRNLLDKGIEPPDGDEDISRRKLRVKEFSNRFSRNYLYPIVRQVDDLSKYKQPHPSINQKMLSAYHVIFNGLVAYQNHLPTSIGACSSDKLKLLLKHLVDLCDIHFKIVPKGDENGYFDFIQSYKQNAEVTIQKIEDQFTNACQTVTALQLSAPHIRSEHRSTKLIKKQKNNLEDRLYMYSNAAVPKKDSLWKRAAEALGKKKLNIKSRYKTAQFKHRPPMERLKTEMITTPSVPAVTSNCKMVSRKSTTEFKKTPFPSPINEDNISTMIQIENKDSKDDRDNGEKKDELKTELMNHEKIVVKLLQLVLEMKEKKKDNCDENVQRSIDEKISNILEKVKMGCDYEVLKETLNELQQSQNPYNGELELKIIGSTESFLPKSSRSKKEPSVTVTGVKNAKLICIKDDNSIETDYEDLKDDETEKVIELKPIRSKNQSDSNKENKDHSQKPSTSLNMKRSSKSSKYLKMLPKDYALSIIQYKIDFHKHCKVNPMYRRTTKITPWILMNKLSDKILDLALLGVAKEVEISDVVEKIYQSELQFC